MKKNSTLHKLNTERQTVKGLAITSVVELILAYGFASWAIDSGSLLIYFVTILLLIDAVRNVAKLIKVLSNGKDKSKSARRTKK